MGFLVRSGALRLRFPWYRTDFALMLLLMVFWFFCLVVADVVNFRLCVLLIMVIFDDSRGLFFGMRTVGFVGCYVLVCARNHPL